jgi:predicted DsbA family dithiol-disulfide isomerase
MRTANIDVFSDFICPWCYIGKRRLEVALRYLSTDVRARVRWQPFALDRGTARGALEQAGTTRFLTALGAGEGIDFAFDRVTRVPDTANAHRLVWLASSHGGPGKLADAVVERLYRAFWCEGQDIGSLDTLAALAGEAGMDARRIGALLASAAGVAEMQPARRRGDELGIEAIPFILINDRVGVRGTRSSQDLAAAIQGASWFGKGGQQSCDSHSGVPATYPMRSGSTSSAASSSPSIGSLHVSTASRFA